MKRTNGIFAAALAAALTAGGVWAQQKAPQPKSQKEVDALQAVSKATTPDEQLKAIDNVLLNFADTEYKVPLLQMAVNVASQKGDYAATTTYSERLLAADPKNIFALSTMAREIPNHTREFDLDKDEKLAKAEKYAKETLEDAPAAPKPNPQITDEQWEKAKKEFVVEAHADLGKIDELRKQNDAAINEFKTAQDMSPEPSAVITANLGDAYLKAGKYDDAIAAFDKAAAMPDANAQVKAFIAAKKAEAAKAKTSGAKPASGATAAPGQVEIKK